MIWIKKLFERKIYYNVKYLRIKKPAKDEVIIFIVPEANETEMRVFMYLIKKARDSNTGYLFINKKMELVKAKKKQVRVK